MESVQRSRQMPHCTRQQRNHFKSVFLSTVLLALVGLLHVSARTELFRHSRRPMCHCAEITACDSSHVPPQATTCATTTSHRHYQAVWTFCWSPRKGSWKHSETLLCHPLGLHRLSGCAVLTHPANFMLRVITACDVAATARPTRRRGSRLNDPSESLTVKEEESPGTPHTRPLAGPERPSSSWPAAQADDLTLPGERFHFLSLLRLPLIFHFSICTASYSRRLENHFSVYPK